MSEKNSSILLASHGTFAKGILESVSMILGEQADVETFCLERNDSLNTALQKMTALFEKLERNAGTIIFTDIYGGTPSNVAATFLEKEDVQIFSGMNLPVLLELFTNRSMEMGELVKHIETIFPTTLTNVNQVMQGGEADGDSLD